MTEEPLMTVNNKKKKQSQKNHDSLKPYFKSFLIYLIFDLFTKDSDFVT